MFYVYILHNSEIGKYYIGFTTNLNLRLLEHNKHHHKSKFTRKNIGDWKLVYYETFTEKTKALKREKQIKKMKSKKYIENLIAQESSPDL